MISTVLRIDALFEIVLAAYVVIAVAIGPDAVRMADPASNAVLVAVAVALTAAGAAIWWLALHPDPVSIMALAVANAAGGVIFLAWLAAGDGFSLPAAGLVIVVSAALLALAAAELVALPPSESAQAAT
jgi:hypothetical protein